MSQDIEYHFINVQKTSDEDRNVSTYEQKRIEVRLPEKGNIFEEIHFRYIEFLRNNNGNKPTILLMSPPLFRKFREQEYQTGYELIMFTEYDALNKRNLVYKNKQLRILVSSDLSPDEMIVC